MDFSSKVEEIIESHKEKKKPNYQFHFAKKEEEIIKKRSCL